MRDEAKIHFTGTDEFDGGGQPYSNINMTEEQISDNFFNITAGVTYKIGKHQSHLFWHDPFQEVYSKLDNLANKNQDIEVCKKGDQDNDGVCCHFRSWRCCSCGFTTI